MLPAACSAVVATLGAAPPPPALCINARGDWCYDKGVERGHIVPRGSHSKRPRGASAAGASGAPQPQQMGRSSPPPEMPSTGISSIWEIHALYGFRRVPPHLRAACSR